jgi:methylmalonyl-CoA mutase cobalamin-binding domain/chain
LRSAPQDWRQQTREQKMAVNQFHIAAIAEHFRGRTAKEKVAKTQLSLDQRLANYIIEGSKDGLVADLELKRAEGAAPLDIINGPLMAGMSEVGRLFNNNELIVAEVLQSAEAMKAAVGHLEQFMEKADTMARARIVLATVKGDVHDIGKNLVEIILKNNGYDVVNLGIKVPPEDLIKAYREHKPDAIGLSGLLVKSAQQMVVTANDLKDAGVDIPLLVGGAALSEKYTMGKIAPTYSAPTFYAKDAMTGLRIMNEIMDPALREEKLATATISEFVTLPERDMGEKIDPGTARSAKVRADLPIPTVPYLDRRVRTLPQLPEIWGYINPFMLYGRHMGYKGNFEKQLLQREEKALALYDGMEQVKEDALRRHGAGEGRRAYVDEGARSLAVLRSRAGWQLDSSVRARRERAGSCFQLRPAAAQRRLVSERLRARPEERRSRSYCAFCRHGRRRRARQVRSGKGCGRVLQGACHPGARHRDGRSVRRVRPSPLARRLGLCRSGQHVDAGALHVPLSRQALQLRLPRVPEPGRSAGNLEADQSR